MSEYQTMLQTRSVSQVDKALASFMAMTDDEAALFAAKLNRISSKVHPNAKRWILTRISSDA